MNVSEKALAVGRMLARSVFDKRSKGHDRRNVEAHIGEAELAALLAVAAEHSGKSEKPRVEVAANGEKTVRLEVSGGELEVRQVRPYGDELDELKEFENFLGCCDILGVLHHVSFIRVTERDGHIVPFNDPRDRLSDIYAVAGEDGCAVPVTDPPGLPPGDYAVIIYPGLD